MFFFFFSSRRRHTRLQGDWSSDVCSSDLTANRPVLEGAGVSRSSGQPRRIGRDRWSGLGRASLVRWHEDIGGRVDRGWRSEERRVGKGGGGGRWRGWWGRGSGVSEVLREV